MTVTNITLIGIKEYTNVSAIQCITEYISNILNTKFNIEIIPQGSVTFFRFNIEECEETALNGILNCINRDVGDRLYEYIRVTFTKNSETVKIDVDGCHDINI